MANPIVKRRKVSFQEEQHDVDMDQTDDSFHGFGSDQGNSSDGDSDTEMRTKDAHSKNRTRTRPQNTDTAQLSSAAMAALATGGTQARLLQLQISSRLEEVKPPSKRRTDVDSILRRLKSVIEGIPAHDPVPIIEAENALQKGSNRGDKKSKKSKGQDSAVESVIIPFPEPRPTPDSNLKVAFASPEYVDVVGSYVSGTSRVQSSVSLSDATNGEMSVDLTVCMPTGIFQEKDYLNYRYSYKRAYYLAVLAHAIKNSELGKEKGVQVWFEGWRGNMLQPAIVVRVKPRKSSSSGGDNKKSKEEPGKPFRVTILPILQTPPPFPLPKLSLGSSNIRSHSAPTPMYNSTILMDCAIAPASAMLRHAAGISPNFTDATLLGRLWLQRNGFGGDIAGRGFGGSEWALLQATLIGAGGDAKSAISPGCSTLQMFRAMLHFLGSRDLGTTPYGAPTKDTPSSSKLSAQKLKPVFILPGIGLNVLFKMSAGGYEMVRRAASAGVRKLAAIDRDTGCQSTDVFDALWGQPTWGSSISVGQHDLVVRLDLDVDEDLTESDDGALDAYTSLIAKADFMQSIFSRGLSDRSRRVDVMFARSRAWGVSQEQTSVQNSVKVTFGISVNPTTAERLVDLGPYAEEKEESAMFREFWGDKAELRRFKDGSIRESCVWSDQREVAGGERVVEQICRYLVQKYAGIGALEGMTVDGGVDLVAELSSSTSTTASAASCFQPILNAFQALHLVIRDLDTAESLPLRVRSFSPSDEQLRYASILGPDETNPIPADVTLQFEFSARWPDDLEAIQRTKVAFLLKVGECLSERDNSYSAQLGLENPDYSIQNQAFLDIRSPTGFVFRLRIQHEREEELLRKILSTRSTAPALATAAATALSVYRTFYLRRPQHTAAFASASTRFPSLSETVRLLKFWFSKHGLLPHLAPELIELFAIKVFTDQEGDDEKSGPTSSSVTPGTGVAGFIQVLNWLASWDWRKGYAIIKLSGDNDIALPSAGSEDTNVLPQDAILEQKAKAEKISRETLTRFRSWRSIDPTLTRLAMFVATDQDADGAAWTEGRPAVVVAARMTALARTSIQKLNRQAALASALNDDETDESNSLSSSLSDFEDVFASLFKPQWKGYDFVLHLDEKVLEYPNNDNQSKKKIKDGQFKNMVLAAAAAATASLPKTNSLVSLSGPEMVSYFVADISNTYGSALVLFWDPVEGNRIGGLWNPGFSALRRWKPRIGFSSAPVKSASQQDEEDASNPDGQVVINKKAMLAEIWRLGGDMVKKVEGL